MMPYMPDDDDEMGMLRAAAGAGLIPTESEYERRTRLCEKEKPRKLREAGFSTRVTVKLSPRTMDALNRAAEKGNLNQTDTINRAIQIYDYLLGRLDDEMGLTILDRNGERERLHLY